MLPIVNIYPVDGLVYTLQTKLIVHLFQCMPQEPPCRSLLEDEVPIENDVT